MNKDRINYFISLEKQDIISLFAPFDASLEILDYSMLKDSMSNTGYMVETENRKYLLKIYSNTTDKIETAAYRNMKDKINVPELYFYDDSREHFQFVYTITEFLNGIAFIKYVRTRKCYPVEKAYEIGKMCATVHQQSYECDALLDDNLNISSEIPYTHNKILHLLDGKPKRYLNSQTIIKLGEFINKNAELFCRIEAESVLCHGDFSYGNIMICADKVYFIDFEFAYSGSRYHDIGHFFRNKDADVQALINDNIYAAFVQGYNDASETMLPPDWLRLARLCDINAMLCLLNYDNVPDEWVEDIEHDILFAIEENKG